MELALIDDIQKEIAGINITRVKQIVDDYDLPLVEIDQKIKESMQIIVTDESDTDGMTRAKSHREWLKAERIRAKKNHDKIKENVKIEGAVIDFIERKVRTAIQPAEDHLIKQEKFAEEMARLRQEKIKNDRMAIIGEIVGNRTLYYNTDMIGTVSDELFEGFVLKVKFDVKEHDDKVNAERLEREKREALVEQARKDTLAQNERLIGIRSKEIYEESADKPIVVEQKVEMDSLQRDKEAILNYINTLMTTPIPEILDEKLSAEFTQFTTRLLESLTSAKKVMGR